MNNFKRYFIGFLVGLLGVGTVAYSATNGSIGDLFKYSGSVGSWVLMGDNIEDETIDSTEIENETITSEDIKNGEIKSLDIFDNSIVAIDLATNSVGDDELIDNPTFNRITSTSDTRSPIYYDRNNTGYYGNFASTSRLNQLNVSRLCDENGNNCKDVSSGLGGSSRLNCQTVSKTISLTIVYYSGYPGHVPAINIVVCPAGTIVTGGGARSINRWGLPSMVSLYQSGPSGNGWYTYGTNNTVYARCCNLN